MITFRKLGRTESIHIEEVHRTSVWGIARGAVEQGEKKQRRERTGNGMDKKQIESKI
jgi:hypothetical protein